MKLYLMATVNLKGFIILFTQLKENRLYFSNKLKFVCLIFNTNICYVLCRFRIVLLSIMCLLFHEIIYYVHMYEFEHLISDTIIHDYDVISLAYLYLLRKVIN